MVPLNVNSFSDEDWVTLSAIQHYSYCERQYALIYKEQLFEENYFTMHGRLAHERPDTPGKTHVGEVTELRSLTVWSDRYGLYGKCDVVEFQGGRIFPVEYKHGHAHTSEHDEMQLCAQGICLEEMFDTPVLAGAIYHIGLKHRTEVEFTATLRNAVLDLAERIRAAQQTDVLPQACYDKRCTDCSLIDLCMPMLHAHLGYDPMWAQKLPKGALEV